MKDWFLENQFKLGFGLGIVCVAIVFVLDARGPQAVLALAIALLMIYVGSRLFENDTSENWLSTSYGGLFRNVIGGVLMLTGWVLMLRGVIALAIASVLLRSS